MCRCEKKLWVIQMASAGVKMLSNWPKIIIRITFIFFIRFLKSIPRDCITVLLHVDSLSEMKLSALTYSKLQNMEKILHVKIKTTCTRCEVANMIYDV